MFIDAKPRCGFAAIATALLVAIACSNDPPVSPDPASGAVLKTTSSQAAPVPTDLVSVTSGGESISFWPYVTPNGTTAEDPVSLVLAGRASAIEIRAALLALDGNRGGPWPPLGTWSDAVGGVQAAYVDGVGWVGSVIQLSLGQYGPFRVHLRLFDTGQSFGGTGTWVLGTAHMELQTSSRTSIPIRWGG